MGGRGGRTFAPVVALAVEEGPPSPAARLGPILRMGRAARSKAHALSGHARPPSRVTEANGLSCARACACEPRNARGHDSSPSDDHLGMLIVLVSAGIVTHCSPAARWFKRLCNNGASSTCEGLGARGVSEGWRDVLIPAERLPRPLISLEDRCHSPSPISDRRHLKR